MARRLLAPAVVAIAALGWSMSARATFHLWEIGEVYSNADGTVQYVELFTTFSSQNQVGSQEIVATWNGGSNTFTFPGDLPTGSTADKRLLVATPGFSSLEGAVSADFTFPAAPFFDPAGGTLTINFVGADTVTFSSASLPTDGTNALYFTAAGTQSTGTNSPTNFAGANGSLVAAIFSDGFESPGSSK